MKQSWHDTITAFDALCLAVWVLSKPTPCEVVSTTSDVIKKHDIICKQLIISVCTAHKKWESRCPADKTDNSKMVFKYYPEKKTWTRAHAACQREGGTLAMPKTKNIYEEMRKVKSNRVHWIGLRDHGYNDTFLWVDGSPLSYTNWEKNEPSHYSGLFEENCVGMYWKWNSLSCWMKLPFLCQYK